MKLTLAAFLLALLPGGLRPRDGIDAFFDRLDEAMKPLDRYPGGVAGLAKKLGGDPAKIRELLSTLEFEPYLGVMKGAEGTLVTGGGNSFDQALLAAALLAPHGKVRFALGDAPIEKVRELFLARVSRQAPPGGEAEWKKARERKDSVWQLVDQNVDRLSRLLEGKGVRLEPAATRLETAWCWVEFDRDGKWTALSEPPAEAREHFDAVPDRFVHKVEVYARLELPEGAKVRSEEILRASYASKDLFGHPVVFRIAPAPGDSAFGKAQVGKDAIKINPLVGLRAVRKFMPSVTVGRSGQMGRAFDLDGRLYTVNPAKGFAHEGFEGAGNRVAGLLGGAKAPPGPPTALWWGVKRIAPGQPDESWEREIVDLTGFGKPRAKLARLEEAQKDRLLLSFFGEHEVHLDFGDLAAGEGVVRIRRAMEPMRSFFREIRAYKQGKQTLEGALRSFELENQVFTAFEVLRTAFRKDLEVRFKSRSFAPAAGVVVVHSGVRSAGEGKYRVRETFDIMDLPRSIEGADGARFRLALGVLDTEMELLSCSCTPPIVNTASLIRSAKPELRCLTKAEEANDLPFKEAARERVKADLRAGHVVIAPDREIEGEATWWRVDPRTGSALGIGETGCGQTAVEYWTEVYDRLKEVYGIGKILYCYLMAIWTNPITPNELTGEVPGLGVLKDIYKCMPICDGVGKIIDNPDVGDFCDPARKWMDKHVLGIDK